jgi:acetolactate synthase-1/2/3 large subunit
VTHNWTIPAPGTPIVQIDIDPSEIGRSYPGTVGVVGDAKMAVIKLAAALGPLRAGEAWLARTRELVGAWQAEIEPLRRSEAVPIRPERLCKELGDALPENAVLVADTGYASIWTATMLQLRHPEQTYLRAAGSLGWGFPAALGAKCAAPDRPVICFTGDGGFWYHLSELETACRYGINTVTIINNNNGLAQGIDDIHRMYGGRSGNPEELYAFSPVSFARIAEEMGCLGIRVEHPDQIGGAIRQGLGAQKPAVVEVMTGLHYRAPEPWGRGG